MHTEAAAARAIAIIAHRGQYDHSGIAFIDRPRLVAERLTEPQHVAAGWLHAILTDSDVTAADLRLAGISEPVVDAVVLLAYAPATEDARPCKEVRRNPIALAVKRAAIAVQNTPARPTSMPADARPRVIRIYESDLFPY